MTTLPIPPSSQTSAFDVLRAQLAEFGLEDLAGALIGYQQEGLDPNEAYLRLKTTEQYKARFSGNQMRKAAGLRQLSEAEYISKERALEQQFALYDLPKGFYNDPSDYAKAIASDLGAEELGARLDARRRVVEEGSMTGVLAYAQEQYGLGTGDLIAFFIDPDRATNLFDRMAKASEIGAAAKRTGFGGLAKSEAERLMDQGITTGQAIEGFGQAASLAELQNNLDGEETVSRADLMGSIFDENQDARTRVERVQAQRKARFQGGGAYAEGREGIAGLGSANTG